jgi:hypothetical protein
MQIGGFGSNYPLVRLSNGITDIVWGITEQTIANNSAAYITTLGFLPNVNTLAWAVGTKLYCINDGSGQLTDVPNGPTIATVMVQDALIGVLYVNSLSAVIAPSSNSYTEAFLISDWIGPVSDHYYIDIVHSMSVLSPQVEVWEGDSRVLLDRIQRIDNNTVRLLVTADPDERFNGTVIIVK